MESKFTGKETEERGELKVEVNDGWVFLSHFHLLVGFFHALLP